MRLHLIHNTSPEDAERWADLQAPRYSATQETAVQAAERVRRSYHPLGCDNQGRNPERAYTPSDAVHCASEIQGDEPKPRTRQSEQTVGEQIGNFIGWGTVLAICFTGAGYALREIVFMGVGK